MRRRPGEDGMALLTVLMLVGVMGALIASTLEVMSRSVALTSNSRSAQQARHYARGAALIAAERLATVTERNEGPLTLAGGWADEPIIVPTPSGSISISLSDASHCFNVNSLVAGTPGQSLRLRPAAVSQLLGLMTGVGIGPQRARGMVMGLVDFIDSDPFPESGGAEDEAYPGYRTPNSLVADVSELTAVANWTADDYALLEPYLCALPTTEMQAMNVNTLTQDDAPLLGMLVPQGFSLASARRLIAQRPAAGWKTRAEFWSEVIEIGALPGAREQYQIAIDSDLFRADIRVEEAGFEVRESALISVAGNRAQVLQRSWMGA